jgi:ketosteroid isomerase-like protein
MTQSPTPAVRDAIAATNRTFMEAFGKGNASGAVAVYTRDAKLLPPNSDFVSSAQAIRGFWQGAMDMGVKQARLETVELEVHGEAAFEVGTYVLEGAGGQPLDSGKYMVVW